MARVLWTFLLSWGVILGGASALLAQRPGGAEVISTLRKPDVLFNGDGGDYASDPFGENHALFTEDPAEEASGKLQLAQYPLESSAGEETIPPEMTSATYSGPFGYLKEKLDCLPRDKKGFVISKSSATATIIPDTGRDGFQFNTLDVRASIAPAAFPLFQMSPRFGWHLTDGSNSLDVPSQLYDTGVDFSLFLPFSDQLTFLASVGPSLFTDGENLTSSAFRITGMAIGFYKWSDTTKLALGVVYLDRQDIRLIPAVGVIYQPSDGLKYDLMFPRPKVSYRLTFDEHREHWCYVAGEFGGGSWAVERRFGADDVLTYKDYRLIVGMEQSNPKSLRWLIEGGLVFGRKIEYESGIGGAKPDAAGMIRLGVTF